MRWFEGSSQCTARFRFRFRYEAEVVPGFFFFDSFLSDRILFFSVRALVLWHSGTLALWCAPLQLVGNALSKLDFSTQRGDGECNESTAKDKKRRGVGACWNQLCET